MTKEQYLKWYIVSNCILCGKKIWKYSTYCKSCMQKGENNSNYKNGKYLKENHCLDCQIEISCNAIRCPKCNYIYLNLKGRKTPKTAFKKGNKAKTKKGIYKNINMRSGWEIKFAFFLDCSGINWRYESKTFDLGITTYTPDFYIPEWNLYIEIKGYWRDDAKVKFEKFKNNYPNENIKILLQKDLQKMGVIK